MRLRRHTSRSSAVGLSLPREPLVRTLAQLTAAELCLAGRGSLELCNASRSPVIWNRLLDQLWRCKSLIPDHCRALRAEGRPLDAYRQSLADSTRCIIQMEELSDCRWSFRFKQSAGEQWTDQDPWWQQLPARTVQFLPDGVLRWEQQLDGAQGDMHWTIRLEKKLGKSVLQIRHDHLGAFPEHLVHRDVSN